MTLIKRWAYIWKFLGCVKYLSLYVSSLQYAVNDLNQVISIYVFNAFTYVMWFWEDQKRY